MPKTFLYLCLATSLIGTQPATCNEPDATARPTSTRERSGSGDESIASLPTDIADRVRATTVRIEAKFTGKRSTGTGVVVRSNGMIVTALHVVAGAHHIIAKSADGKVLECSLIARNSKCDVAILSVRDSAIDHLCRADVPLADQVSSTQDVVVAGHPHAKAYETQVARTSPSRQVIWNDGQCAGRLHALDVSLAPGYSGGGVFNVKTGDLIGVAVADGSAGYYLPISKILQTLDDQQLAGSQLRGDYFRTPNQVDMSELSTSGQFDLRTRTVR